jgi:hypothetical protein
MSRWRNPTISRHGTSGVREMVSVETRPAASPAI